MMRLAPRVASGPLAPMRAANAWASGSSRSAGYTPDTSPIRSISSASTSRPVQMSSSARPRPTIAGRRTGPPAPGKPPQRASGKANVARERQLGRSRARDAVERDDDDLGKRLDRIVEAVGDTHQLENLLLAVGGPHRGIQDPHREELGSASRDDDHVDLAVAAQAIGDALQGYQDITCEPVLVGRPSERDRDHAPIASEPYPLAR